MESTGVCTEFRYLLVRLGRQLHLEDCEGLMYVHRIPESHTAKADIGLHILSKLEAEGYFDPFSPDKLQEIFSKIGRKDLAQEIKEYKQSNVYKKAAKLENEREKESKKKSKKNTERGKGPDDERRVAANLLFGVEMATTAEERKWRDMFAMALCQTAQLVEQTELLRKAIANHDDSDQTNRRIDEALNSIITAQGEVATLSKTLRKAISAAGLRASQEGQLDDTPDEATTTAAAATTKKPMIPQQSPRLSLTRANTFDGNIVTKTTSTPISSLTTTLNPSHAPATPTPTSIVPTNPFSPITSKDKVPPPVKSKPLKMKAEFTYKLDTLLAEGSSPGTKPNPGTTSNTMLSSTTSNNSTMAPTTATLSSPDDQEHVYDNPNISMETMDDTYINSSMLVHGKSLMKQENEISNQEDSGLGHEDKLWGGKQVNIKVPAETTTTAAATAATTKKLPVQSPRLSLRGRPRANTFDGNVKNMVIKTTPTLISSLTTTLYPSPAPATPTPIPIPTIPTSPSTSTPSKNRVPPPVKSKPSKPLMTAEFTQKLDPATTAPASSSSTTLSSITSNNFTMAPTTATLSSPDDQEHVYNNPNISMETMDDNNSKLVHDGKSLKKQESDISIQEDSGLGHEDKSWGGELVNMKEEPQYMNARTTADEYAVLKDLGPSVSGGQYTVPNKK